jgi:anti-sigma B factor antagonist
MSTAQIIDSVSSWLRPRVEPAEEEPKNTIALHLERHGETLVLQVAGQLSVERVGALQTMFKQMWKKEARRMVIDLTGCSYVDSSGLATLVQARERTRKLGRDFVLVGLRQQLRNILRLTRLDTVFVTQDTYAAEEGSHKTGQGEMSDALGDPT